LISIFVQIMIIEVTVGLTPPRDNKNIVKANKNKAWSPGFPPAMPSYPAGPSVPIIQPIGSLQENKKLHHPNDKKSIRSAD
jgi:hypothetical protein